MRVIDELVSKIDFKVDSRGLKTGRDEMGRFVAGAKGAGSTLKDLRRSMVEAFSARALLDLFRGTVGGIIDVNRRFQVLHARLVTVEGSAEKAGKAFRLLREFAQKTPFEVENATDAYVRLKSQGIEPTTRMMTSFGDIAAGMGKDIVDFSEAVNDAQMGEFERLKEFGIKASVEGDKAKITFKGITQTVERSGKAIVEALTQIGEQHFAGAMERQSKTLDGAFSNLKDAGAALALQIGEGGVAGAVERLARELTTATSESGGLGRALGQGLSSALDVVIDLLLDGLKGLRNLKKEDVRAFFERLKGAVQQTADVLRLFAAGLRVLLDLFGGPRGLLAAYAAWRVASKAVNADYSSLGKTLDKVKGAFSKAGIAIGAFTAVVAGSQVIVGIYQGNLDKLRKTSNDLAYDLLQASQKVGEDTSGQALADRLASIDKTIEQVEARKAVEEKQESTTYETLVGALGLGRGNSQRSAALLDSLREQRAAIAGQLERYDEAAGAREARNKAVAERSAEALQLRATLKEAKAAVAAARRRGDKKALKAAGKAHDEAARALANLRGEPPPESIDTSAGKAEDRGLFGQKTKGQSAVLGDVESAIEQAAERVARRQWMRTAGTVGVREEAFRAAYNAERDRLSREVDRGNLAALGGQWSQEQQMLREAGVIPEGTIAPPVLTVTINRVDAKVDAQVAVNVAAANATARDIADASRAAVEKVFTDHIKSAAINFVPRQKV